MAENVDVNLVEQMKYYSPRPDYRQNSWVGNFQKAYDEFLADPYAFWSTRAQELDWKYPYAMWYTTAKLTITANCRDRHVDDHRRTKGVLIWKGKGGANESTKVENVVKFKNYTEG